MRSSARTWIAVALTLVTAAAVLVPLASRIEPSPAAGDPLTERLAEATDGEVDVRRGRDDVVRFVGTSAGRPLDLGTDDPDGAAASFVARYGDDLGVADLDLEVASTEPRRDGGVAVRYQQVVDGIPVFGAQASVQVDEAGGVLSSLADLSAPAVEVATDTGAVGAAEARLQALAVVARETGADPNRLTASAPERWIYDPAVVGPPSPLGPRLTWRVDVTGDAPPVRHLVLVDAERGGIALSFSQLAHALDRGVCDGRNLRSVPEACNAPYDRGEGDLTAHAQDEVNRAYDYSGDTYDFFWGTLGRDSIDGKGMTIESRVRHCPSSTLIACPYKNAFWNGEQLTFGDGFATDDVVAHELTHGVTEFTANLFYYYQSGSINESMSDVFGEFVDLGNGAGNDSAGVRWLIGEDLLGGAIRDMGDPTLFNDPDRMTSPKYVVDAGFTDQGGVHSNSGVGNRAASLLTDGGIFNGQTVTGLDIDKTAAVFYEALTTMLTSGSDYADLGIALAQSCTNLVGGSSGVTTADCAEVDKVVLATEMAQQPVDPAARAPEAPVCGAGLQPQEIWGDDFEGTKPGGWGFDTVDYPEVHPDYRWAFQSEIVSLETGERVLEYATSGVDGLWGPNVATTSDRRAHTVHAVSLPPGTTPYLRFAHAYHFETSSGTNWDGGVAEYSTNGGASWNDLGPLFAGPDANGYNGALVGGGTNPLAGRSAFVDRSHGYVSSRADLTPLAGQDVRFRFRVGTDEFVGTNFGWFVDDVSVYTCTPIPAPDVTLTQTADQEAVVGGEDIDLHLEVHNTGNVALTAVQVTDATAPDCETLIPALAVDAKETIDCTYTTVDPDDVGTWSNIANVTATEIPPPGVDSNPVSVEVAAPAPDATVTMTADQGPVTAGQSIALHVTVENTGNVALTGITVDAAVADLCDGPVADLAPGARATVDCSHPTVDPDDIGPWSDTATVTATPLAAPIQSSPVEVQVLAPNTPAAKVTASADQASVVAGQPIDLHVTVENTGNVALTGLTLTHSAATSCDGPVADLGVGAQTTVDCSHPTLDPDDIGPWADAATLDAVELTQPVVAAPVAVTVHAPAPSLEVATAVDKSSVSVGDAINLAVTVRNTGNVDLNQLIVTAADAPECTRDSPSDLPVGEEMVYSCTDTPTALGPWSTTLTVSAESLAEPVVATSDTVQVLDATDPSVTITSPADGALFNRGQTVIADYACADEHSEVACAGPVQHGQPIDTSTPGEHSFQVDAVDAADNTATLEHTYTVADRRPDARLRKGAKGTTVGNNRYNATGVRQTRTSRVAPGRQVTHFVTLQNDGSHPEAFRVHAQPSTTNYSVQYFTGGANISKAARRGNHQTPELAPGAIHTIKVVVTVGPRAPAGGEVRRLVTATSTADPQVKDVVRIIVRRR